MSGRRYKKKTKYARKRRYRKKSYPLMRSPVAKKMITKLRYNDGFSVDPPSGGISRFVLSCNGLYDPDVSGTGHQPRGFDQIMPLYDHYVVVGAEIRCMFVNASSAINDQNIVGIALKDTPTQSVLLNDYLETGYVRSKMCSSQDTPVTITYKCNPNKFLGRSKPLSDPDLKGSALANPVEQAYFHGFAGSAIAGDGGLVQVNFTVDYIVVFIEPKNPAQS